jgi:hypothetical protein
MGTELPKGFYTGPDGSTRFWDGQAWFDQPAGTQGSGEMSGRSRKAIWITIAIVTALLLCGAGAFAVKTNIDAQTASAAATSALAVAEQNKANAVAVAAKQAEDARVAASSAAKADADMKQAEVDAEAAQQATDDAERGRRADAVTGVEKSVLKMARDHAKKGVVTGPIKKVDCVPVAGGSLDDLTQVTAKFECFAVYKVHSDGTSSGYYYNATMNWDTGSYTYGYGRG